MSPVPETLKENNDKSLQFNDDSREDLNALMVLVYEELHRQAHRYLRLERQNHTLQTTALINEVYLRLVDQNDRQWRNKTQFFGVAGNMMRRILVDYAKTKHRAKRGGIEENIPLDDAIKFIGETPDEKTKIDLISLDKGLTKLSTLDERQAKIVELKYFSGLTVEEIAEILEISEQTIIRDWRVAKAWLHREISNKYTLE